MQNLIIDERWSIIWEIHIHTNGRFAQAHTKLKRFPTVIDERVEIQ